MTELEDCAGYFDERLSASECMSWQLTPRRHNAMAVAMEALERIGYLNEADLGTLMAMNDVPIEQGAFHTHQQGPCTLVMELDGFAPHRDTARHGAGNLDLAQLIAPAF
jgi:hypothetical protein